MNEADVRKRFQKKFFNDGHGILHRIVDSPPTTSSDGRLRSSGKRPFDLVGVGPDGQAVAVEVKFQRGGKTFNLNKVASHQMYSLNEWARFGGIAWLVIGWLPVGKTQSKIIMFLITGTNTTDGRIDLESCKLLPDR